MGGNGSKTGASNYAKIVNNDMSTIVNDVSMLCQSSFDLRSGLFFINNISDSEHVTIDIDVNQTSMATMNAECLQNSEVYNTASSTMFNSITQFAEAIQKGFIPPPSSTNSVELVNNVSKEIVNKYSSECIAEFKQQQLGLFANNVSKSNYIDINMNINQTTSASFISKCVVDNIVTTQAFTDLTNYIDQTAKSESSGIITQLVMLAAITAILFVLIYFFGSSVTAFISRLGLSILKFVIYVAIAAIIVLGIVVLTMWIFKYGLWAPTREEKPYTWYDEGHDSSRKTAICGLAGEFDPENKSAGILIDGFNNCIASNFSENASYSYWCKNDTQNYENFGTNFSYFYPIPETLNEYVTTKFKHLPPEMFRGLKSVYWPVDIMTVNLDGVDIEIGKWPINLPANVSYTSENFDFWRMYYSTAWLTIRPGNKDFFEAYPTLDIFSANMQASPMGVCSGVDYVTNSFMFNWTSMPMTDVVTYDQGASKTMTIPWTPVQNDKFKRYQGLESPVTITYSWDVVYPGFQRWFNRYAHTSTYDDFVWQNGLTLPETAKETDKDEWWDFFMNHQTWDQTVLNITAEWTKSNGGIFLTVGEIIGEAIYEYRNNLIISAGNANSSNKSAYNKAWVGDGLLLGEELVIRNLAIYGQENKSYLRGNSLIAEGNWENNTRGYLCFYPNDQFVIENNGESITVNAQQANFESSRAVGVSQCLRTSHLASESGYAASNFGCSDYLKNNEGQYTGLVSQFSACCEWKIGSDATCDDYSSYLNPYRCDSIRYASNEYDNFREEGYYSTCKANTYSAGNGISAFSQEGEKCKPVDAYTSYASRLYENPNDKMAKLVDNSKAVNDPLAVPTNPAYCSGDDLASCIQGRFQASSGYNDGSSAPDSQFLCENRSFKYRNAKTPNAWSKTDNGLRTGVCMPKDTDPSNCTSNEWCKPWNELPTNGTIDYKYSCDQE